MSFPLTSWDFHWGQYTTATLYLGTYIWAYLYLRSYPIQEIPDEEMLNFWSSFKPNVSCPSEEEIGELSEERWICGVDRMSKNKCLIYSFGLTDDFTFESELIQRTKCKVHLFDYNRTADEIREILQLKFPRKLKPKRVHFHREELANIDIETKWRNASTLQAILFDNDHRNVNLLKLDVNGSEVFILANILKEFYQLPFDQLIVDFHFRDEFKVLEVSGKFMKSMRNVVKALEGRGVLLFRVKTNVDSDPAVASFSFMNRKAKYLFLEEDEEDVSEQKKIVKSKRIRFPQIFKPY